ncbi:ATP-binding domain-containing protein [Pseudomonas sp. NPDC089547]|uniref:ATP-binding domain-containing protein n=1 Tax=Pseudomonas sp. NPDC089547 TaxID=3390652 RepID=UPI003D03721C
MSSTWWVDESELLDEQIQVLEEDLDKDLILMGPPGSGKTNLLLLRANHLVLASPDAEFYIVCYTSLLKNFVRTGADLYSFPANRIITQRKLLEQVLGDHDFLPPRKAGESYSEREAALKNAMTELMSRGMGHNSYPVIFVDEAQDYSVEDLNIFKYLAKNLCCAADLRQGIYGSGASGSKWLKEYSWAGSITLKYHYRVAPAILKIADKIMAGKFGHTPMLDTHEYKGDPGDVDVVGGVSLDEQVRLLSKKLIKQLAIYPNQTIGVLVPRRAKVREIFDKLIMDSGLTGSVTNAMASDFDPNLPIWVSTVHSSKGLEYRCAHIVSADELSSFNEHERRVVFMAVTRAKTILDIYHLNPLHAFFASALAKPNTDKVSIKNLFGKKI